MRFVLRIGAALVAALALLTAAGGALAQEQDQAATAVPSI